MDIKEKRKALGQQASIKGLGQELNFVKKYTENKFGKLSSLTKPAIVHYASKANTGNDILCFPSTITVFIGTRKSKKIKELKKIIFSLTILLFFSCKPCVEKRIVQESSIVPVPHSNDCFGVDFSTKYLYEYPIQQVYGIDEGLHYTYEFYEIYAKIPPNVPFNEIVFEVNRNAPGSHTIDTQDVLALDFIASEHTTGRFLYHLGPPANYTGLFEWNGQTHFNENEYVTNSNFIGVYELGLLTSHFIPFPSTNNVEKKIGTLVIMRVDNIGNMRPMAANFNIKFRSGPKGFRNHKGVFLNCSYSMNIGNYSEIQANNNFINYYIPHLDIKTTFNNNILIVNTSSSDNWIDMFGPQTSPTNNLFFDEATTDFSLVISKIAPSDIQIGTNQLPYFNGDKTKVYNNINNPIYNTPNTTSPSDFFIQNSCKPFRRTHTRNHNLLPNTWYGVFIYYRNSKLHRFSNIDVFKTS